MIVKMQHLIYVHLIEPLQQIKRTTQISLNHIFKVAMYKTKDKNVSLSLGQFGHLSYYRYITFSLVILLYLFLARSITTYETEAIPRLFRVYRL